jgi:hypothetical protein
MRRLPSARPFAALTCAALLLAACGEGDGSSTSSETLPTSAGTEPTASSAPSTTVPPATAAPATTAPVTTPAPTVASTAAPTDPPVSTAPGGPSPDPALVLAGGAFGAALPLGWWDGEGWTATNLSATAADLPAATGDPVQVSGIEWPTTASALGAVGEACFDGREGFDLGVTAPEPSVPGFGYSVLGVVGDWDPTPRPVRPISDDLERFRDTAEREAATFGADGTLGEVVQALAVDLDGDGVDEELVAVEYAPPSVVGSPGDFSVVYLRRTLPDSTLADEVLFSSAVPTDLPEDQFPYSERARVLGVADANGDGVMEVALHEWYYEGASVSLWTVDDAGVMLALENGCGA